MKDQICLICGKVFIDCYKFCGHIKKEEKLTIKDYYDKFYKKENEGKCPVCKSDTKFTVISRGYLEFCSRKCTRIGVKDRVKKTCMERYGCENVNQSKQAREKTIQTNLERYGVTHSSKSKDIKEKRKKIFIEKYGVDNPSRVKEFQDKRHDTFLERFGVDNPYQNEEIKKKIREGNIKKYGFEVPSQSEEVKEKMKKTNLERYGKEYFSQSEQYNYKIKNTCQEKYGVNNVFQAESVKEKSKITSQEKYNEDFPTRSEEIKEKIKKTNLERYGFENYSQTDSFREFARNKLIEDIEKRLLNGEKLGPRIGNLERECLNFLQINCPYIIDRQKRFNGYFLDGYIKELNLAIEFDEKWHKTKNFLIRDDYRRDYITKKNGTDFLIITENQWFESKENVLKLFSEVLNNKKNKEN